MKKIIALQLMLIATSCQEQKESPFDASDLQITWTVIENLGGTYKNSWKISNVGQSTLPASGWTLYYNHVVGVPVPESISGSLAITQISGTYYSITPTTAFKPLSRGESTRVDLECIGSGIKITDAPSGIYLLQNGQDPQIVNNYKLGPFPQPSQLRRSNLDNVPVPTTELRYQQNASLSLVSLEEGNSIVPTPMNVVAGHGYFKIPGTLKIGFQEGLEIEARHLKDKLETSGQAIELVEDLQASHITLTIGSFPGAGEAYNLNINQSGIRIEGSDPSGVFYGCQSLISLWPLKAWQQGNDPIQLACQTISDAPRFGYRGFYLDVARNFHHKEAIKQTLDIMAFYKLNRFLFGVSNDEGWRLEISKLPELTKVGAIRGHTTDESDHLFPAYGSGPFPQAQDNHGTGHYSRQDFIDILKYANERHIEVIPEINFPGHARAAIKAMESRDRRIAAEGSDEPTYLLHDPDDQSVYQSVQGYNDNVICPCQESIFKFLEVVVGEVVEMYQEAGAKLTAIHTGGDEVPAGIWENSPLCQKFLKENPQIDGTAGLPGYFLQRYNQILDQHQLVTAGWEEIAMHKVAQETGGEDNPTESRKIMVPNPEFINNNFLAYVWLSIWGVAGEDLAYQLANTGYKVVMSNASNLYFDFAYNKDPMEPGFYWAGFVNTRKPFELVPLDVLQVATVDVMGNPLDMERYQNNEKLSEQGKKNVLGIQGQLFSETVKGPDLLEYYLFPKMIGLAERAWAPDPSWAHLPKKSQRLEALDQAWNLFSNKIGQRELIRLDYLWDGVNYRVPLPGAIIEDGVLKANVGFPGLTIRYTADGTEPTQNSSIYEGPVEAKKPLKLKAFTATEKSSRTAIITY